MFLCLRSGTRNSLQMTSTPFLIGWLKRGLELSRAIIIQSKTIHEYFWVTKDIPQRWQSIPDIHTKVVSRIWRLARNDQPLRNKLSSHQKETYSHLVGKASDVLVFAEVMHQGTGSKVTGFLQSLVCLDNRTRTEILQKEKERWKKRLNFLYREGVRGPGRQAVGAFASLPCGLGSIPEWDWSRAFWWVSSAMRVFLIRVLGFLYCPKFNSPDSNFQWVKPCSVEELWQQAEF